MEIIKRWQVVAVVCLLTLAAVVYAEDEKKTDQNKSGEEIKFVDVNWTPEKFKAGIPKYKDAPLTHVAVFSVKHLPAIYRPPVGPSSATSRSSRVLMPFTNKGDWSKSKFKVMIDGEKFINDLLETKAAAGAGDQLKEIIKNGGNIRYNQNSPINGLEFKVYANSKEDAEILAKAILETFKGYASIQAKETADKIAGYRKEKDEAIKLYDDSDKAKKEITEKIEKIRKERHYPDVEKVTDRIMTLNSFIEDKKVQLDGMEAKMEAIDRHLNEFKGKDMKMVEELEAMQIKVAIDMAAVRGEHQSAMIIRDKADEYVIMTEKAASLERDKTRAKNNKSSLNRALLLNDGFTSRDQSEWFMPVVDPAVVTVYSLESGK